MIVVDKPVFNPKEADVIAQALCDELGGQFVYADAKAEGNILLKTGAFKGIFSWNLKSWGNIFFLGTLTLWKTFTWIMKFSHETIIGIVNYVMQPQY